MVARGRRTLPTPCGPGGGPCSSSGRTATPSCRSSSASARRRPHRSKNSDCRECRVRTSGPPMPSPFVNRYAVYVHLVDRGKVREPISQKPSLLLAVQGCISAYETTGHESHVIEDSRPMRAFTVGRRLLLACVFLRANDRPRYFEVLDRKSVV